MFKDYRPLLFFSLVSLVIFVVGLIIGIPVIHEFNLTHYVSKVPSAVLACALMIITLLLVSLGLILDHQTLIL